MADGARSLWMWLRQVTGDAAYESYLRAARTGGCEPMSRTEFYLDSLQRRYSTPSRCC